MTSAVQRQGAAAVDADRVTRTAPQWAWDIIDQTLALDSQSGAFSLDLREDIARALDAMGADQ